MQVGFDYLQGTGIEDGWMRTVFNVPAMVPATVLTYTALAADFSYLHPSTNNINRDY
jgi:hypothetical protein